MTELDFESSHVQLLTEALRAGPGSPQWREALEVIPRDSAASDYERLYAARERLASGRSYREVRAGPGFTREVFDAIDRAEETADQRLSLPSSANLIAGISALVILGVLGVVAFFIIPRADTASGRDELAQTYFTDRIEQNDFASEMGAQWAPFGNVAVQAHNGLRPAPMEQSPQDTFAGGGATFRRRLPSDQAFAVEASIRFPKVADDTVVQLFVTDDPDFAGERATSPHELVWLARAGQASVALPSGAVEAAQTRVRPGQRVEVRLALNRTQASVETDSHPLWSGGNQLDPTRPRIVGIRFLTRGGAADPPVIESVRLLVPQK